MTDHSPDKFEIAILCALPREFDAVRALLDEDYGDIEPENESDPNRSEQPRGALSRSFLNIGLGLLVGVCAGAPRDQDKEDILLGDVIISTAVIQYDYSREYEHGLVRKDTVSDNLPRPNTKIRAFLKNFETEHTGLELQKATSKHLERFYQPKKSEKWGYPGLEKEEDMLFEEAYIHKHTGADDCPLCKQNPKTCEAASKAEETDCKSLGCDREKLIERQRLKTIKTDKIKQPVPMLHLGVIASGDRVIKSSSLRQELIKNEKVIGFEMEGAGVWDTFPTIVIKGVCDYADSHKNKGWQRYASATAASCMKAMLEKWSVARQARGGTQASAHTQAQSPSGGAGGQVNHFSGNFHNSGQSFIGSQINSGGGPINL
ncbi:hypothetical protein BP6252_12649 [Coleophoma cylindrospora]|uniref:Nucleoside phosphorylase domain-containing protein n=1 Tax=Coleophoma cylindrospora TaxID=1849047 RepID=A0A3D8QCI1_9HELO|nr:hypothetical protein BP6252_12649 [Coleophoma cylindrospora]